MRYIKKVLILLAIMSLAVMATACRKYEGDRATNASEYAGDDKTGESFATFKEIRDSKDKIMQDAFDGRWSNLIFDNIEPRITDENEIYNIKFISEKYKGLDRGELFDEMLKVLYEYYPNADEGVFKDSMQSAEDGGPLIIDVDEQREKLNDKNNSGDYIDHPTLGFEINDGIPHHYNQSFFIDGSFNDVRYSTALVTNIKVDSMDLKDDEEPNILSTVCETVKTYYAGATDGSLNDEWQLQDGKMSVKDAIEFTENYLNNDLKYETNPDIHMDVYEVDVLKVTDDMYAYYFRIRREIYGLVTNRERIEEIGNVFFLEDMADAEMINHKSLASFGTLCNCSKLEKQGEPITEIVSLESAINTISEEIGLNSSYKVHTIELSYDSYDFGTADAWPAWMIQVENTMNEKRYLFVINAVSSAISCREVKKEMSILG